MNKKGSILILSIFVIAILMILGVTLLSQSISEHNLAKRYLNSTHAFWAAEAGVNRAIVELRNNYSQCGVNVWSGVLSSVDGGYEVDVACVGGDRNITIRGFTSVSSPQTQRIIEAIIKKDIPTNFYDNALYTAGDVDFNGSAYTVVNDESPPDDIAVLYAGDDDIEHPEYITGEITQDASISPLARFDFDELHALSEAQTNVYPATGNVYDVANNGKLIDPITGVEKALPSSFWYTTADDGVDNDGDGSIDEEDEWVPNIVYIKGDLKINGSIGTVGGFLVVAGDVTTNPDDENFEDVDIVGEGQVDGVIYTLGELNINGGGAEGLDVNGGIWAGEGIRINGSADILYNADYMTAIGALDIEPSAQVVSWREQVNPYSLTP